MYYLRRVLPISIACRTSSHFVHLARGKGFPKLNRSYFAAKTDRGIVRTFEIFIQSASNV